MATVGTALLLGTAGSAQTAGWDQGWSGQATLYGWVPAINGSQEGPDGQPLVDLDNVSVLESIDMAFMGSAIVQKGKFGVLFDAVYADLGTDGTWVQNRVETSTTTKLGMYTAAAMYRAYEDPKWFADVYAGARYFDLSIDFNIGTARLGEASFSRDLDWTDFIVGVRGGVELTERWELTGFADVGGFEGSDDTSWQLYGGTNYAFSERWVGTLGYRYVSIEKSVSSRAALDIDLQGPLLGISYRF